MSESKLPRHQDEFFSVESVEGFFKSKTFAVDNVQTQAIIDTLKDIGKLKGDKSLGTLLDVGCGYGVATSLMARHFDHVIGIDLSANQIRKAREIGHFDHIEFKVASGDSLPVADGSVDVITNIFSVQHFDIDHFLKECRRALKPGGVAIFYEDALVEFKSLEDDKLPTIVDEIKEMKRRCLEIAEAVSHPDRYILDDFQALYNLIDWPKKRKITRKVAAVMSLEVMQNYTLSIPLWSTFGAENNPVAQLYNKIERAWNLKGSLNTRVHVTWDAIAIVLNN